MTDSNNPHNETNNKEPIRDYISRGIGMFLTTSSAFFSCYGLGQNKPAYAIFGLGMLYAGNRFIDRVEEAKRHREIISAIKSLENRVGKN